MNEDEPALLPCHDKLAFDTVTQANAAANVAQFRYGTRLKVYKCRYCGLWHLSSQSRTRVIINGLSMECK